MRTRIIATGGVALALLAGACSNKTAVSTYSPGSVYSPQTSASGAIYSPGQTDGGPGSLFGGQSASPPPQAAGVVSPSAGVTGTLQGGKQGSQPIALSFGYVTGYPLFSPPDGLASVAWQDAAGNTLSFGVNHLFKGTQKTGVDGLSMVFTLTNPERAFTSGDGTCTVTVTDLEQHALYGKFNCAGVKSANGQTLNAQGTFGSRLNVGV